MSTRRTAVLMVALALLAVEVAIFAFGNAVAGWMPDGAIFTIVLVVMTIATGAFHALRVKTAAHPSGDA